MLGVVLLLTLTGVPAPAGAQTRMNGIEGRAPFRQDEVRAVFATFEGRKIDLSGDWGEAQACLVWRQGGVMECFRDTKALEAREAQLEPQRAAALSTPTTSDSAGYVTAPYSYSCSSSLRLYENNWYSGRRLSFWDRGYWQNLWWYGFNDQTSSYIVGSCPVYLAEHGDGGGGWYPGPTYPYAGDPNMYWDWQDTISSIYLA